MGPPADEDTDIGPLVSYAHRDNVAAMVERARNYATIRTSGTSPGGQLAAGAFYSPTLITDSDPRCEIVTEEVFGPVLTVLAFDSDQASRPIGRIRQTSRSPPR